MTGNIVYTQINDENIPDSSASLTDNDIIVTPIFEVKKENSDLEEAKADYIKKSMQRNSNKNLEKMVVKEKNPKIRFDCNRILIFDQDKEVSKSGIQKILTKSSSSQKSILKKREDDIEDKLYPQDDEITQIVKRMFTLCGVNLKHIEGISFKEQLERLSVSITNAFNTKEMCSKYIKQKLESQLNDKILEQQETVKYWKNLFDESTVRLKELEKSQIQMASGKLKETVQEQQKLAELNSSLKNELAETKLVLKEAKCNLEFTRAKLIEFDNNNSAYRTDLQKNKKTLKAMEDRIKEKEEKIRELGDSEEKFKKCNKKLSANCEILEQKVSALNVQNILLSEMNETFTQTNSETLKRLQVTEFESENIKNEFDKTKSELTSLKKKLSKANKKIVSKEVDLKNLRQDNELTQDKLIEVNQELGVLKMKYCQLSKDIEEKIGEISYLKRENAGLSRIIENLQDRYTKSERQNKLQRTKYEELYLENQKVNEVVSKSNKIFNGLLLKNHNGDNILETGIEAKKACLKPLKINVPHNKEILAQ
ncbi:hypothetical protein Kpol_1008p29 [Vanderwaltozyma polyspora DSM 70294]|uniref:Uncharacterized protein n=1 Tax=Vanderwaltozyma polyspora (strain ATCC 22028 / DSM 70294 / BCRC 21397 / CBS 2163 / NBRC 10782 / NRRL Y-8283 / UCD 57-17) TaxID=436907 RepID=A7TPZ2_VANPO|nr:uncharacterized protein Kpol_1008p29 [Vanderwaltozyma polyspora DSM 70294]EDO15690.1 hypothetical protein Kpol_1008p29 [Vanderwaltozyma polyspora DSM 70294]